jgi:hypothetical protein
MLRPSSSSLGERGGALVHTSPLSCPRLYRLSTEAPSSGGWRSCISGPAWRASSAMSSQAPRRPQAPVPPTALTARCMRAWAIAGRGRTRRPPCSAAFTFWSRAPRLHGTLPWTVQAVDGGALEWWLARRALLHKLEQGSSPAWNVALEGAAVDGGALEWWLARRATLFTSWSRSPRLPGTLPWKERLSTEAPSSGDSHVVPLSSQAGAGLLACLERCPLVKERLSTEAPSSGGPRIEEPPCAMSKEG